MKVKLWCDNGANIYSCREEIYDVRDFGYTDEEFKRLSDQDKCEIAEDWADDFLDIGIVEVEEPTND